MMHRFVATAIPVLMLFAVGCTTCPHRARYEALKSDVCPGLCGAQRDGVVAVVIGPETVFDFARVGSLTNRLHEAGFARVYRGGPLHMAWLEREIQRTHAEEPETRFVVVGYALGGHTAHALVANLGNAGVPVESLVLLDPFALDYSYAVPEMVNVTIVRSNGWTQGKFANAVETAIPGVGHIDLPNNPETVGTVVGVLASVAAGMPVAGSPDDFGPRPAHLGQEWDFILGPSVQPEHIPGPKPRPERTASTAGN